LQFFVLQCNSKKAPY